MYRYTSRSPSSALVPFSGEGSPTKIDYRIKATLILTSTGGPRHINVSTLLMHFWSTLKFGDCENGDPPKFQTTNTRAAPRTPIRHFSRWFYCPACFELLQAHMGMSFGGCPFCLFLKGSQHKRQTPKIRHYCGWTNSRTT